MSDQAKIGALVALALAVAGFFLFRIENRSLGQRSGTPYVVELDDAQGLTVKSLVLLKGIRVGRVSGLTLEGEKVHVSVLLQNGLTLRTGTRARVVSVGLLGEKQVQLTPGPADAPPLPPGSLVPGALSLSLDDVIATVGSIGTDLRAVTANLRGAFGGEEGAQTLASLIDKTENLLEHLDSAVAENRAEVAETVRNLREFSRSLRSLTATREGVGGSGVPEGGAPASPPSLVERLERASSHLEHVAQTLDSREGTLGRLIQDPGTGERIDQTLEAVRRGAERVTSAADWAARTRFGFGVRGEYLTAARAPRGVLQMDVRPPSNFFLRFEAIARGARSPRTGLDDGAAVRGSALVGWRQRFFAVRAGLMESRLGAGADLFLFKDRIRLSADAWDPSRARLRPHARIEGAVQVLPPLSLLAGWDELLNADRGLDSFFLGASLKLEPGAQE
ncbi:MAG TPA: MlaD family protein [Myxococcaceae bacterium]|nr:MlaD family protein [Myxococcaceae bacterium]